MVALKWQHGFHLAQALKTNVHEELATPFRNLDALPYKLN